MGGFTERLMGEKSPSPAFGHNAGKLRLKEMIAGAETRLNNLRALYISLPNGMSPEAEAALYNVLCLADSRF